MADYYELPLNKKLTNEEIATFCQVKPSTVSNNKQKYINEILDYYICDIKINKTITKTGKERHNYTVIAKERYRKHEYIKQREYKREVTFNECDRIFVSGEPFQIKEKSDKIYYSKWVKDEKMIDAKQSQCYTLTRNYKIINYGKGYYGEGKKGRSMKRWCKLYEDGRRPEVLTDEEYQVFNAGIKVFFSDKRTIKEPVKLLTMYFSAKDQEEGETSLEDVGAELVKQFDEVDWTNFLLAWAKRFNCSYLDIRFVVEKNPWEE